MSTYAEPIPVDVEMVEIQTIIINVMFTISKNLFLPAIIVRSELWIVSLLQGSEPLQQHVKAVIACN